MVLCLNLGFLWPRKPKVKYKPYSFVCNTKEKVIILHHIPYAMRKMGFLWASAQASVNLMWVKFDLLVFLAGYS
jgi:hypothetical protein